MLINHLQAISNPTQIIREFIEAYSFCLSAYDICSTALTAG